MTPVRNEKGHFIKGHPFLKPKPGHKNGRPKTIAGQVRDALSLIDDAMPEILKSMADRACGREECPAAVRQAASEYLCDRIYGKPNQPLSGIGKDLAIFFVVGKGYKDADSD